MSADPAKGERKRRPSYSLSPATLADLATLAAHTAALRGGKPNVSAMIAELARAEMQRRHLDGAPKGGPGPRKAGAR